MVFVRGDGVVKPVNGFIAFYSSISCPGPKTIFDRKQWEIGGALLSSTLLLWLLLKTISQKHSR